MNFNLLGIKKKTLKPIPVKSSPVDIIKEKRKNVSVPPSRVSVPTAGNGTELMFGGSQKNIIKPDVMLDAIPYIRSLYKCNPDLGAVLFDLIQLTNTGYNVKFDQKTDPVMQDKMRMHLKERGKTWGAGTAGINGLLNKITAQLWVSGAIAIEAAPNRRLTQIDQIPLINPETIRFELKNNGKYHPYQKVDQLIGGKMDYIKLNTNTFTYVSLFGDEDTPYGVPPFLTALNAIITQQGMTTNMNHILDQMGLLGYLQVLVEKPQQDTGESESAYEARLTNLLNKAKTNVQGGFKEGIVAGYDGDHEFNFTSTTKNLTGVNDLYNLNENQIANGLKSPGAFLGLDGKGGEGQLGIIFTKMLSQIKNVHATLSYVLERIFNLELQLAGYSNYKTLEVVFNTSTIGDDLKLWQGKEIKQRVLDNLYTRQIIGSEQYADEMGYQEPFKVVKAEDAIPIGGAASDPEKDKKREEDKDKSDRKTRDKNKAQPKRKDQDTK